MNFNPGQNKSDKLWKFSEDLIVICILGALWVLCSLPVITIGDATTAMYTVFLRYINYGKKELVKPFFTAFKDNFKNTTIIWLIVCTLIVLFAVDSYYYLHLSGSSIFHWTMGIVMICLLIIVMLVTCYAFPIMALYKSTVKDILIKSIQYSYISWQWTILALAVNLAVLVLVALGLWFFIFLIIGAAGYANSYIMIKALRRDIPYGRIHF